MAKSLERPLTNESALAQFVSDTCVNRTRTSLIIGSSNYAYSHEKGLYRAYLTWCNHSDFYPVSLATLKTPTGEHKIFGIEYKHVGAANHG